MRGDGWQGGADARVARDVTRLRLLVLAHALRRAVIVLADDHAVSTTHTNRPHTCCTLPHDGSRPVHQKSICLHAVDFGGNFPPCN